MKKTQARAKIIEQGLAKRGWIVGQNLRIEYRYASSDQELMKRFAAELVALKSRLSSSAKAPRSSQHFKNATRTIPIVFVVVGDPVGSGFVDSIARPGGNVTGFTNLLPTITGKYLSILRELKSQLTRVAIMYNPEFVPRAVRIMYPRSWNLRKNSMSLPIAAEVHSSDEIETAMADLGAAPDSATHCDARQLHIVPP